MKKSHFLVLTGIIYKALLIDHLNTSRNYFWILETRSRSQIGGRSFPQKAAWMQKPFKKKQAKIYDCSSPHLSFMTFSQEPNRQWRTSPTVLMLTQVTLTWEDQPRKLPPSLDLQADQVCVQPSRKDPFHNNHLYYVGGETKILSVICSI